MGFAKKIELREGIIGIWEISEEAGFLASQFNFSEVEKKEFENISADRRKREFIIVRMLLEELLNRKPDILYDASGRPSLKHSGFNLSISHSQDLVVVFLSHWKIGIDAENAGRKIENVAHRFLNESEKKFVKDSSNQQKTMILLWCAKEAIFKCSEKQGIDFCENILVPAFSIESESVFTAVKSMQNKNTFYRLQHFIYKNNVVVFCVEEEKS